MKIFKAQHSILSALGLLMGLLLTANASSVERTFEISQKYLNIPIQSGQARQQVVFEVDGEYLTHNDIALANEAISYWTFVDVSKYQGKTFSFLFSEEVKGMDQIYQSDSIEGEATLYNEKLRPQIHFTTQRGWTNDPNGMVFYEGEYHLFYQHNPYETGWGNMTWGHAVSKDLLHWKEIGITLLPDELGTMFSGSAVIDYHNTAGFNDGDTPAMVAMYTADLRKGGKELGQSQCIAYSLDKGRTFTKYEGNPVIPSQKTDGSGNERDPKVFWYEPGQHWVMIQHEAISLSIYNSNDLKHWEKTCAIKTGFWECPELFELPIDGDQHNKKWVVYGVDGTYQIGDFNGKVFTPETELMRYNIPGGMTAAQTFNDEPKGRRIQMGWGHVRYPDMPFTESITFPMEFSLKTTPSGVRLFVKPVEEIENLYQKSHRFGNELVGSELNEKLAKINTPLLHLKTTVEVDNARFFELDINGYKLKYDVARNTLNGVFIPLENRQLQLELIIDKTIVEVFVNRGRYYWFASNNEGDLDNFKISFNPFKSGLNQEPKTWVKDLEIHELKSIWK